MRFSRSSCLLSLALVAACATNPATGKKELMLVSEDQEAALGKQAAAEVPGSFGIYEDRALQAYVRGIGRNAGADLRAAAARRGRSTWWTTPR